MANKKHFLKLKEGVGAWNQWRKENPGLEPDLQCVNLSDAQLQNADLSRTQLQRAFFARAQLQGANLALTQLQEADFGEAQLQGASFYSAQLQGASFYSAQLQGAYLYSAQLQGANLREAQLQGADLSTAQLQGANLSRANLEETTLDGITLVDNYHVGPQVADIRWGETNLAVVDWSQLKILGDEYKLHRPTTSSMVMKSKATDLEDYRTAVRANRQLAVALRDQGLNEDADRFAYRAQVLQRKVLWKEKQFGRGFFSGFLALVAGYGYRMERILFTYAIVVSLFAAAYFILGMYYPPPIPLSQAFFESITAFHGRVFFEQFSLNTPQIWVTAGEAIAGLVVEGVFIAMLTQRFFGR